MMGDLRNRRNRLLALIAVFSYVFGLAVAVRAIVLMLKEDMILDCSVMFFVCAALMYVAQCAAAELDEPEEYILIEDYDEEDD